MSIASKATAAAQQIIITGGLELNRLGWDVELSVKFLTPLAQGAAQFATLRLTLDQPVPKYTLPVPKAAALAALGLGDFLRAGAQDGRTFTRSQVEAARATLDKLIEIAPNVGPYVDAVPWDRLEGK